MKRILYVSLAVFSASCGANYSPNSDLAPDPNQPATIIAATNQVCRQCTADADCGPNAFCATEDATGDQFCTAPCYSDGTCDTGLTCFTIDDQNNTGCYPSSGTCEGIIATSVGVGSGTDSGSTDTGSTTASATTTGTTTVGATSNSTTTGTTTSGATTTGTSTSASATSSTTTAGATTTGTTTSGATSTGTTTSGATTTVSGTTTGASSTTGTTGACTTDTWNTTMKTFFTSNCSSCHNVSKSFADSGKSRIDSGAMPPNGGLSSSDIQRVDNWIGCGSP